MEFKLATHFSTFMSEQHSVVGMPLLFWASEHYFKQKNEDISHLSEFFRLPPDWEHQKLAVGLSQKLIKSMKELGLGEFVDSVFTMVLIILDLISLKVSKSIVNEWVIEDNTCFQHLLKVLKIDKDEFDKIMLQVQQTDDKSMKFDNSDMNPKVFIDAIVFNVYEKLTLECTQKLNSLFPKDQGNYKRLKVIQFSGFSNKKINFFDDLHTNYLNERVYLHQAESALKNEKHVYQEEGLQEFFPQTFEINNSASNVVKLINNVRKPPGIYQILETVNKLGQSDQHFQNNVRKFLGTTDLLKKDRLNKNFLSIEHSFGEILYDFDGFVSKNKYFLNDAYFQLFQKLPLDFLKNHEVVLESVTKYYKTDLYRNFLTQFLVDSSKQFTTFLNCINFDQTVQDLNSQVSVLKLTDILDLLRKLHPFKVENREFVRRYLVLKGDENRFFDELPDNESFHDKLSKDIIDYFYKKKNKPRPKIIFGIKRIFAGEDLMNDLEEEVLVIKRRLVKWENFL